MGARFSSALWLFILYHKERRWQPMTEQPKKKRRPGRPATGRKRDKTLNMKFTEKERAYLKDQAKQLDLSLSNYVLKLAKYYEDNH